MGMRLAIVVPTFPSLSETFVVRHVVGLLDRGWDVHVICAASDRLAWSSHPTLRDRDDLRHRVHVAAPTVSRRRSMGRFLPTLLRAIAKAPVIASHYLRAGEIKKLYLDAEIVGLSPDLVHFEFGGLAVGRMALVDRLDRPVVVSFRGFDLNFVGLDEPRHYDEVWRRADALHFLGEDLWRRARERGCPADKPRALIPPAVDADRFRPPDRRGRSGPVRILSVGRLEWKKGYERALLALRRLVDRGLDFRYSIVGDGSLRPALAHARHQLDLEQRVELLGAVPHEEIVDRLATADLFFHPAVSEGFGNAVLEAQAMALPVVATDADGLAENIAHGVTGWIVPRRDPRAMADRLFDLARNPEARFAMGQAGRNRVLERFRPEAEIDAFEALYRQCLS